MADNLLMTDKNHDDNDKEHQNTILTPPETSSPASPSRTASDKTLPCRRYIYYFNSLPLFSTGSLQVYEKSLVVTFPERPTDHLTCETQYLPYINVFVNKQQLFSFEWLPVYTKADLEKCQDILYKLFQEYLILTHFAYNYPTSCSGPCDIFEINYQNHEFSLFSQEYSNSTTIQIDINKNSPRVVDNEVPTFHVQLYIGSYLIFCSHRDLSGLSEKNVNYVTTFILSKIAKF
jgi:hypothetical protein